MDEVVRVAHEARVVQNLEHHEDVSGRTAARPDVPLPAEGDVVVGRHARRDLYLDVPLHTLASLAMAESAWIGDLIPLAATRGTGARAHELAEDAALDAANLSSAAACFTRLRSLG